MSTPTGSRQPNPTDDLVTVQIAQAIVTIDPPAWNLAYLVANHGTTTAWLVADNWLVFSQNGNQIELSLARHRLQPGTHVFGYFDPAVTPIPANGSIRRPLIVPWPAPLSDLWNARSEATPPPGRYDVSIRVGYGFTPAPDPPGANEDVEDPVQRWQQIAVSPPLSLDVPIYTVSNQDG